MDTTTRNRMSGDNLCGLRTALLIVSVLLVVGTAQAQTPVGTRFSYQGQLKELGAPASGAFHFEFNLYDDDDPDLGTLIGTDTHCSVSLSNGTFTVFLDFGDVFSGEALWLQIGISSATPCDAGTSYTYLDPLQPLTAVPYALFALSGNEGPQGPKGDTGNPGPQGPQGLQGPQGDSHWSLSGSTTYYNAGNVGIGTTTPAEKLEVNGTVKATAFVGDGSALSGVADDDHTHDVVAGSSIYRELSVRRADGNGTYAIDVPVGFSGATRFKMYYETFVNDTGGSSWYGKRRGLIEGTLGGPVLDIASFHEDTTERTIPEIGWGDTTILGFESVEAVLPSVSVDGLGNELRLDVTSILAVGTNVRITFDVSNGPSDRNWTAYFLVKGLIAYK